MPVETNERLKKCFNLSKNNLFLITFMINIILKAIVSFYF